jgi:precorrin-6B methylase 1
MSQSELKWYESNDTKAKVLENLSMEQEEALQRPWMLLDEPKVSISLLLIYIRCTTLCSFNDKNIN